MLDIGELTPQVDPARRLIGFVNWCADFIGGLLVKFAFLTIVAALIVAVLAGTVPTRTLAVVVAVVAAAVAWTGLAQLSVKRDFRLIDEGRGIWMYAVVRRAALSGLPVLGAGVGFAVLAVVVAGERPLDVEAIGAIALLLVTAIGGPAAATVALARYGAVFKALDTARARRWPRRFGLSGDESDVPDDAADEPFDPDDPAFADPRDLD